MNRLLEDKVAVVTGSSQGLGLAIAIALGVDGAKVVVTSRATEKAKKAASTVEGAGGAAAFWIGDLTAAGASDALVSQAAETFGGLDIVVNCAGLFLWKPLLELSLTEWQQVIDANLTSAFRMMQSAARLMIDQGRGGSIVNIASVHGSVGDPNVVAQCASKFGLVGLTKASANALRPFGIRVNAIAPGSIEPDSAQLRGESPADRVTQADVAMLLVYLVSDFARTITGSVIEAFGSTHVVIKT